MSTIPDQGSTVALAAVLEEEEPLLDLIAQPPVNKKVEACKEALYSACVGAAWGLATSLPVAGIAYANSGVAECVAVGAVAATVASFVGGFFGTVVKNSLTACSKRPIFRAVAAGYGTTAIALSIYNATFSALFKTSPIWMQFAVGGPAVLAGALAAGCTKPRLGRLLSGFVVAAGTGCLTGVSLGKVLSIAMPQVGPRAGPMLGLFGVQGMIGYIIATDKYKL